MSINKNIRQLEWIDSLRGIAILLVLLVHTLNLVNTNGLSNIFRITVEQGRMGVQLFYMASAFTLFYSLSKREEVRYGSKNFFIRRFFRIAPMFYIAIIYYFWRYITFPPTLLELSVFGYPTLGNILSHFTFTHGFFPNFINTLVPGGWSVGVEMIFYLLVPTFFYFYLKYGRKFLLYTLSLSVILSWSINYILYIILNNNLSHNIQAFFYYNFFTQFPVFILGFLLFDYIINKNQDSNTKSINIFHIIFLISILFFMISLFLNKIFISGLFAGSMLFLSAIFCYFIILVSKYKPKIIVNEIIIYIGKISYSVYLVHFAFVPIINYYFSSYLYNGYIFSIYLSFVISFFLLLIFSVIVSSATYKYIEKPMIKFGNKLIERINK